jgi:hypothetical protein
MAAAVTRTFAPRTRWGLTGVLLVAYACTFLTYWFFGIQAFLQGGEGPARLLGFAYIPILLLPMLGRGSVWFWMFGVQIALAVAAMFAYPRATLHPRPRRRVSRIGRGSTSERTPALHTPSV